MLLLYTCAVVALSGEPAHAPAGAGLGDAAWLRRLDVPSAAHRQMSHMQSCDLPRPCACGQATVAAQPTATCSAMGDPHYYSFHRRRFDFYGRGLYEHARFAIEPCGCEVVIQTLLVKLIRGWPANSAIAALAIRVGAVSFEVTGGGDIRVVQLGHADETLSLGAQAVDRTYGGIRLVGFSMRSRWMWRLHFPGNAGSFLIAPYATHVMPGGYYYNVWLTLSWQVHVSQQHPGAKRPSRTALPSLPDERSRTTASIALPSLPP